MTEPAAEFDDVERNGPFVSSAKAVKEIARLASENGLSYTHNPGGGEFFGRNFRCQITTMDDLADLATLREALANRRTP